MPITREENKKSLEDKFTFNLKLFSMSFSRYYTKVLIFELFFKCKIQSFLCFDRNKYVKFIFAILQFE